MDDRTKMQTQTQAQLLTEVEALRAEVATLKQWSGVTDACDPTLCAHLLQREQLLMGFFNAATQSNVGLFIVDTQLRYLQINQALADINGYSIESHLGQSASDLLPDLAPTVIPLLQSVVQTGQPLSNLELSGVVPSQPGILRHWLSSYFPITNPAGSVIAVGGIVQEITQYKQTIEALRQSEAELCTAQRLAHLGSWQFDCVTDRVTWSEETYRIHGCAPNQPPPQGKKLKRYVHPDDWASYQQLIKRALQGESFEVDLRIIRPDGKIRYIEARSVPSLRNDQGEVAELFGTVLDVTDRKRIEEELRRSETEMKAILATIPDMLIRVKKDGTRLFILPGTLTPYGAAEPQVGVSIYETLPPEVAEQRMMYVRQAIATGERQVYEYEIVINGEVRCEEARIVAINEEEALIVVRDITERHQLEQIKTEFISVVSHELRTPLTSIQVALSLLDEHLVEPSSADGQTMIHAATEGVDRLVRLVNDMLDLERLESGKLRVAIQPCDPVELVHTAIEQIKELANRSNITFQVSVTPCLLDADPDRLVQVLTNLLSNAIRFSPAQSTIEIRTTAISLPFSHSSIQFCVKDQGRGIPSEQLDRIFERFQQVDASDSREKGGTGLGLAICRTIVQQHGGQIWVESRLGKGSTFYFTIPVLNTLSTWEAHANGTEMYSAH